jgi:hypothetical protein
MLRCGGFALVVTVSLLVLLSVIALGFLSLSAVTLRSGTREQAVSEARANARVALMLALGELQKHAGPDQRVTGSGSLAGDDAHNPHWTGVWSTVDKNTVPVWLVSGNEAGSPANLDEFATYPPSYVTPLDELGQNSCLLHPDPDPAKQVRVPTVPVMSGDSIVGRYAWWVADEGTKARVDVAPPSTAPVNDNERIARSGSPQENGIQQLDPLLKKLSPLAAPQEKIDKRRMVSSNTIDLLDAANNGDALSRKFFHDLTTGGYGLPVNVATGGMKTDLSIAFDSSQNQGDGGYAAQIMGAVPTQLTPGQSSITFDFNTISDAARFHLIPELLDKNNLPTGPNWGNLYSYCQLWRNTWSTGAMNPIVMRPVVETDMRSNTWPPYRNAGWDNLRRDRQHRNSAVSPVLSMAQIGFRLSSVNLNNGTYRLRLQVKPVIGIWNPYNVRINAHRYRIKWALYPYLRIGVEDPDGNQSEKRTWLRTLWLKSGMPPNPDDPNADVFFDMRTPANIDLQPGEIRLFSVGNNPNLATTNDLVSAWNEDGAFMMNLVDQTNAGGTTPVIVPAGSRVWYEGLQLLDVQHPDTWQRFGSNLTDSNTASWFSLESSLISGGQIHRISDFWQTPKKAVMDDLPYLVPEPVGSGAPGSGSASPRVDVGDITNNGSPLHIGTWRCFSRNARDAHDTQKLRGWVDANPRTGPGNPLWDGSRPVGADGYEGWHFLSSFIGGRTDAAPSDGGPPGRGKVAEGQNEAPASPEATLVDGRYRGYGGFSSASSGQSHVPVFDVPRAPLVSLGQLQHAQFSRYQYEPSLPFGNSYANPRIPLDQTQANNFMGMANFTMLDLSHSLNTALWDNFFFSSIGRDYVAPGSAEPLDSVLNFTELAMGENTLPNPRYSLHPQAGDMNFAGVLQNAGNAAPRAITARIGIEGAFNVNSTSVEAWKAVLSSMADLEFPRFSLNGTTTTWTNPTGIRLPKFGHVLAQNGWKDGDGPLSADFWQGYRKLSPEELDLLAREIVKEVRLRGPFRSFAHFVNRDPYASDIQQQRKGALQAALDRALNSTLDGEIGGSITDRPKGPQFSDAFGGESEASGFAGHLMQGDLLQSLAPVLQVRSDSFRIRAMGQSLDTQGRVIASVTCEASVQRVANYLDSTDKPETGPDALTADVNKRYGRQFQIVSFRWLAKEEL